MLAQCAEVTVISNLLEYHTCVSLVENFLLALLGRICAIIITVKALLNLGR